MAGCGGGGDVRAVALDKRAVSIAIDTSDGAVSAFVVVRGLAPSHLRALRAQTANARVADSSWDNLLRVAVFDTVVPDATTRSIVGRYLVNDTAVEFHPRFPFDAGRRYRVALRLASVDRSVDRSVDPDSTLAFTFALPAGDQTRRTYVTRISPSSEVVPANLLRVYIEFSAPMSNTGGLAFVTLRDASDREVPQAFLPLEADFWNRDRTRYTAFLDPGRVKQGILPNEQLGRALVPGKQYSIVVDSSWRDANGIPLVASFRQSFRAGPVADQVVNVSQWRIVPPARASTQALQVVFPSPLDRGLLSRALGVIDADGVSVAGHIDIAIGERAWRFTPQEAWRSGLYQLVVLSILEDPSGNSVERPFEVDVFDRVDSTAGVQTRHLPFSIR